MEELQLVEKARSGDAQAFGALYDAYFNRIYRFIYLKVTNTADAEDLTHQVFLKSWGHIGKFQTREGVPFKSWLYRIANNAVIDFYRTSRKEISADELEDTTSALRAESGLEEKFDESIDMGRVQAALAKLDPKEQNVLIMRFVDELSNKEVSLALQKSEGAVRVIQHRALKKIREILHYA